MKELRSMEDINNYRPDKSRVIYSATHEEILAGATADIYFIRAQEILHFVSKEDTMVTADVFAGKAGVFCGIKEVCGLLQKKNVDIWALDEGEEFEQKEIVLRIRGCYSEFIAYETAILGMLASSSGWATAARHCKKVAGNKKVFCFGARHVHPAVAPVMERAAIVGGVDGCSCILGAKLLGLKPIGTLPHSVMLIIGDTVEGALAYDRIMPSEESRIVLVDTFKDEAEETLRVADALRERLSGVRLDTPSERGGVTPGLVSEIRAKLNQAGYPHVKLLASGGINVERMPALIEAGIDFFGVGSFISRAPALDMTMDLKEIEGKPVAKRGRIPGIAESVRLKKYNFRESL